MGAQSRLHKVSQQIIETSFPNLTKYHYSITSPATTEYNCIAWAARDIAAWWWPDQYQMYFWPPNVPREETIAAFIQAYESQKYNLCNSPAYEEGWDRIALYVDANGKPTHAARQLDNGSWTSKLGKLEDIEHSTLDSLVGLQYGAVAVIMRRKTSSVK